MKNASPTNARTNDFTSGNQSNVSQGAAGAKGEASSGNVSPSSIKGNDASGVEQGDNGITAGAHEQDSVEHAGGTESAQNQDTNNSQNRKSF